MPATNPTPGSTGLPATGGTNFVTVVVAPNMNLDLEISGFRYHFAAGASVVIPAFAYTPLWRDGVVLALSPNTINGVPPL